MKLIGLAALVAASVVVPSASGGSGLSYTAHTVLCRTSNIWFSIGTLQGGAIVVEIAGNTIIDATPQGAVVDARLSSSNANARWVPAHFCKRLRIRTQPKTVIPHPSYSGEGSYDCNTSGPIVAHVHYLRAAGRLTGIYVSVRVRPTNRFVVAGLLSVSGTTRYFLEDTCVAR